MQNDQALFKEVLELFSDNANLQSDFSEAYGLMASHMQKKYVSKIRKIIEKCERKAESNPCAEVNLLKAIKPFAPHEVHEKLDGVMDAFKKYNMLLELKNKFNTTDISVSQLDNCIHNDGVYEVDETCMLNKSGNSLAGMLMIMSVLNRSNNNGMIV